MPSYDKTICSQCHAYGQFGRCQNYWNQKCKDCYTQCRSYWAKYNTKEAAKVKRMNSIRAEVERNFDGRK